MRITVVSGKGGVGKSMIASSLAIMYSKEQKVVAIDCDVDAPNLALWLGINTSKKDNAFKTKKISTVQKPVIDQNKCTRCGRCVQKCNFSALEKGEGKGEKIKLIDYKCEGCGLCEIVCPENAIKMEDVYNCTLSYYKTNYNFPAIEGQIEPGEAESGEAVTEIRKYAEKIASEDTLFIQDAAAGIGCPVIASIVGSDYVVAVAEPSKSSFSDLKRALDLVGKFNIKFGIVINKYDLNEKISDEIEDFAGENYLGAVSYDKKIIKSIVNLQPVIETCEKTRGELEGIFERVKVEVRKWNLESRN